MIHTSATIQVVPRCALLLWSYYHVPFVHAIAGLDFWVTAGGATMITLSVVLDVWRLRRVFEERRSARYWADLRSRHSDPLIDIDEDLF